MGCGVSVLCASAAQQQSQPADEATNADEMNCAAGTHSFVKYSYRPNECKTFLRISDNLSSEGYAFR
jgi:hypothetical protein